MRGWAAHSKWASMVGECPERAGHQQVRKVTLGKWPMNKGRPRNTCFTRGAGCPCAGPCAGSWRLGAQRPDDMMQDFWLRGKDTALDSCAIIAERWREGGEPGAEDLRPGCITLPKSVKGDRNIVETLVLAGCFSVYIGLPLKTFMKTRILSPFYRWGRCVHFMLKLGPKYI